MQGSQGGFSLNLDSRRCTDAIWGVLYFIFFFGTCGIAAHCSSNGSDTLKLIKQCNDPDSSGGDEGDSGDLAPDTLASLPYTAISLLMSVILGIAWMSLLRYHAKPIVYATLVIKGLILIGVGCWLFTQVKSACGATSGDCSASYGPLILVGVGVIYLMCLYCWRSRIEMTACLLEQAVRVVSAHPSLFFASGCLLAIKVLFLFLGIAAYVLLIASQLVVTLPDPQDPEGVCTYDWKNGDSDYFMYGVVSVYFYWSVQLWLCMRYFVVSLTTGVWYYRNESLAAQEGAISPKELEKAPVSASVKLAFTKSFGSIAFASLIMSICEAMRRAARREARNNGLLGLLIACCISCVLTYIEFLTRFALTFHALTGDDFCASGRTFMDHTNRHGFGKVFVVDWMASLVLQFGAVVLGLVATAVTVLVVDGTHLHSDDRGSVLIIVGCVAWLIASIILMFIAGILHDVVDASYSCLILDLDNQARTGTFHQPQMAQVIMLKVQPGYVVQQPGGATAYAQPVAPAQVVVVQPGTRP